MTKLDFRKQCGKEIRKLRLKAGLSQAQLGRIIGRQQEYISRVEAGTRSISVTRISEILRILDHKLVIKIESIYE